MEQIKEAGKREAPRAKSGGKIALITLGALVTTLAAGYTGLCAYADNSNAFYPNYTVNDVDVGGLTAQEAAQKLSRELLDKQFTFHVESGVRGLDDRSASVSLQELGYTSKSMEKWAEQCLNSSTDGSFLSQGYAYLTNLTGLPKGDWSLDLERDQTIFSQTMEKLIEEFSVTPEDATYELVEETLRITKEQNGQTVSASELEAVLVHAQNLEGSVVSSEVPAQSLTAQEVYDSVHSEMRNARYDVATKSITPEKVGADFDITDTQEKLNQAEPGTTLEIKATLQYPTVTAEKLKTLLFRDVLGECRTSVSGTAARKNNVKLASAALNGTVLNAGDVFSYNGTVGQRTTARGYQAAPAYVGGETVDEVGGGVCQPSSTLYLACLRSNLKITERYAHRYAPSYIPWGMDATVSWGGPDYKFTNDTLYPIKIVTTYEGGYLTIKILGTDTQGISTEITNSVLSSTPYETIYQDDPTLPQGTQKVKTTPYTGHQVKTYRNVYDSNGKLISSTFEANSNYKSRNQVILRGTKPVVTTTPEPSVGTPTDTPAETTKPAETASSTAQETRSLPSGTASTSTEETPRDTTRSDQGGPLIDLAN